MANLLNTHFSTIGSKLAATIPNVNANPLDFAPQANSNFNFSEISQAIKKRLE